MLVLRMFPRFKNSITTSSNPTPHPPCGNAPYLNASMYAWIVSTSMPHSAARLVSNAGSWMRCAPEMISSPRIKMS